MQDMDTIDELRRDVESSNADRDVVSMIHDSMYHLCDP